VCSAYNVRVSPCNSFKETQTTAVEVEMIYYDHYHEQWLDSQNKAFHVKMKPEGNIKEFKLSFHDFEDFYKWYRGKDNK
jgi:hypothetical protein